MAKETPVNLRNWQFYQIFIRQFSSPHDFKGAIPKLPYVKSLGTDCIQLVPFHPIGVFRRKGTVGSPYSIKDYYSVDSLNGNLEDFKTFLEEAHRLGMKVLMDIVFNHTSHDANYTKTHPDWYYQDDLGNFQNRVGDWWDIADLKIEGNQELQDELLNVLTYWVKQGIDGFRCDVAPLIPLEFWAKARKELSILNPNLLWVAESVHRSFIKYLRDLGYEASSDGEIYQVFDICYDYDIFDHFENYLLGKEPLQTWVDNLLDQEMIYPKNYVKYRYLENHDFKRIASYATTNTQLRNFNAMLFLLRGSVFLFNGQELGIAHHPNLFEIDEVDWNTNDEANLTSLIKTLSKFKKATGYINDPMNIEVLGNDVIKIEYKQLGGKRTVTGIFNLGKTPQAVETQVKGKNVLTGQEIDETEITVDEPLILIRSE